MMVVEVIGKMFRIFTCESDTGGLFGDSRLIIGKIKHCGP
jgi:hypothetical protein